MPRSSDRGATDPLAALVAVALVCAGLGLYAGELSVPDPAGEDPRVAQVADSVVDSASHAGVLDPDRLASVVRTHSTHRVNVTLGDGPETRSVGPTPPPDAPATTRRVSVRVGPGDVTPARLQVVVW